MKLYAITLCLFLGINSTLFSATRTFNGIDLRSNMEITFKNEKQYLVAYFLNSTCPCSQAHFDHLNQLQQQYSQFSFVGFHSNKNVGAKAAKKYFSQFKIDFPVLLDKQLEYANAFKALKTPHVFIINSQGEVVFQGGATDSRNPARAKRFYLKDALTSLINEEEIKIKNAKTIGCYIQR